MRILPWCMVAMLVPIVVLPAQTRRAAAGRVLDAGGKVAIGSTVTFVGSEPPTLDRIEPADVVRVVCDEKGRFTVDLREGSDYSCWATMPAADGSHRVSTVREDVRAGTGIELVADRLQARRSLRITGLDAWRGSGPLSVQVVPESCHPLPVTVTVEDGIAGFPPLPDVTSVFVLVLDGRGGQLHGQRIESPPGEDAQVAVPPPQSIPVRVVDAAGQPIAGATLRQAIPPTLWSNAGDLLLRPIREGTWRQLGVTAADGTATVQIPGTEDPFTCKTPSATLLASKGDFAASTSGWTGRPFVDGKTVAALPERQLSFTLQPAPSLRGRIVDGARPLAGLGVQLTAQLITDLSGPAGNGTMRTPTAFTTRTDAEGWFTFDCLPACLESPRLALQGVALPDPPGDGTRRARMLRPPALQVPDLRAPAPLRFDLGTMPVLTLVVRDAGDGPARRAEVLLLPLAESMQPDGSTHCFRLDAAGSARLRVQAGSWAMFISDGDGYHLELLTVESDLRRELQLQPLAVMRGQAFAADGAPLAGGRFHMNAIQHSGPPTDAMSRTLYGLGTPINQGLVRRSAVAADGSFEVRFFDVPGTRFSGGVVAGNNFITVDYRAGSDRELRGKPR